MGVGTLILVSLPIGNLGDLTPRALQALREGHSFLAEDTRTFKELLSKLQISYQEKEIFSFHDQSSEAKLQKIMQRLQEGANLYLVSEAGSPIISDPAYPIVAQAIAEGVPVQNLPGVTSLIAGLELSGLAPHPFHFYGFFPRDAGKAHSLLGQVTQLSGTVCFFEAPTRVLDTMDILLQRFPSAHFALARELTKKFETIYRGTALQWPQLRSEIYLKGEFVIYLQPFPPGELAPPAIDLEQWKMLAQEIQQQGPRNKSVAKLVAGILGVSSKDLYNSWQRP